MQTEQYTSSAQEPQHSEPVIAFVPFIAESARAKEIQHFVEQRAQASSCLFLTGEFGTGKTFIAQYVHTVHKKSGAFIKIPCKNMLSADFSFHDTFVAASGGSVFFSEVHALSLEQQKALLSELVANERNENTPAFVEVVASSSQQIETLVDAGAFLPDVYYALSDTVLHIPPLKERTEDILPLALYFLQQYGKKMQKPFTGFSPAAQQALLQQVWKQNVLELKAVIHYACIVAEPPIIELKDLCFCGAHTLQDTASVVQEEIVQKEDKTLRTALNTFKKQYLELILKETAGNQTAAAKILGVQRTYISKLVSSYGIHRP